MLTHILRFISLPLKTRQSLIWVLISSISLLNCLVYARQFAQPFGCELCPLRSWPRGWACWKPRKGCWVGINATWPGQSDSWEGFQIVRWHHQFGALKMSLQQSCGGCDEMERAWWPGDWLEGFCIKCRQKAARTQLLKLLKALERLPIHWGHFLLL